MFPVPPYTRAMEEVPTITPLPSVVRTVLGTWYRVVEPMLETENRVEVANADVEEPMAKRVFGVG